MAEERLSPRLVAVDLVQVDQRARDRLRHPVEAARDALVLAVQNLVLTLQLRAQATQRGALTATRFVRNTNV